jgi:hypothetical protein
MKKFTQAELLDEGFWAGFLRRKATTPEEKADQKTFRHKLGRTLSWGPRAIAKSLEYMAPEIADPINKFESAARDILGMKPKDKGVFYQNLNAAGGTVEYQGKQYLLDLAKGVTPLRNGHYVMKANEVNAQGKKSHKVVSIEMDKDYHVYGVRGKK